MSKPKCDTCGGEDFFTDAGFFYCKECQTQSQDIREEVLDDFFTGQRGTVRTLKKPSLHDRSLIAGEDLGLTSWEIFNYVLKGLVDELIKLGSKQELKIITLQLWASYLYKLEVAFTSSNISRKPKLSLNFKLKDAEIIYGVAKERVLSDSLLRNKRKKRVSMNSGSEASSTSVISKRAAAKKASSAKKALVKAEYEETFSSVNDSFSEDISNQTLESLASSSSHSPQPVKSHKIKLTKHARDLLQKNRIKLARMKREKDKMNYRRNILRKQLTTVHNLTLAKIVALLRLALIFCKEDIYIGDILRWIAEGHLSVNKCEKFIPEEAKILWKPNVCWILFLFHNLDNRLH